MEWHTKKSRKTCLKNMSKSMKTYFCGNKCLVFWFSNFTGWMLNHRSRKKDKLRYRYPRGESYLDVIQRCVIWSWRWMIIICSKNSKDIIVQLSFFIYYYIQAWASDYWTWKTEGASSGGVSPGYSYRPNMLILNGKERCTTTNVFFSPKFQCRRCCELCMHILQIDHWKKFRI